MKYVHLKSNLQKIHRLWQAFQAYSLIIVADALLRAGSSVHPYNLVSGNFIIKTYPRGFYSSGRYSFFEITWQNERYSLFSVLNIRQRFGYTFNLDIALVNDEPPARDPYDHTDVLFFGECKRGNGYSELLATYEGLFYFIFGRKSEYLRRRTGRNVYSTLILSGDSFNTLRDAHNYYTRHNLPLSIYDNIRPYTIETNRLMLNLAKEFKRIL